MHWTPVVQFCTPCMFDIKVNVFVITNMFSLQRYKSVSKMIVFKVPHLYTEKLTFKK